jgi:L-alanine-DL-glutamate epimerase-like enolase superfamily enzyme
MFRFGMKKPLLDVSKDGLIHLPEGPGLGADLDWDWIENHTEEIIEGKSC